MAKSGPSAQRYWHTQPAAIDAELVQLVQCAVQVSVCLLNH